MITEDARYLLVALDLLTRQVAGLPAAIVAANAAGAKDEPVEAPSRKELRKGKTIERNEQSAGAAITTTDPQVSNATHSMAVV